MRAPHAGAAGQKPLNNTDFVAKCGKSPTFATVGGAIVTGVSTIVLSFDNVTKSDIFRLSALGIR
jgi:hypothetical protein